MSNSEFKIYMKAILITILAVLTFVLFVNLFMYCSDIANGYIPSVFRENGHQTTHINLLDIYMRIDTNILAVTKY